MPHDKARELVPKQRKSENIAMAIQNRLRYEQNSWSAAIRDVTFLDMAVGRILNRCDSPRMPFRWTINPYRGCEFGCVYCYARYTHEFLNLNKPVDFERTIFVKRAAAQALFRDLTRLPPHAGSIAIGTATDPYQPAERQFGITRSLLVVLARCAGLDLSITTKSALIVRDLDLLQQISQRSRLSVNFSLTTLDRRLQRILEPRAPRPKLRLKAIATLTEAGVRCNVLTMPIIAGINDSHAQLDALLGAARRAGAVAVWWRSLFLKPAAARHFLPFIREKFPQLQHRFEALYENGWSNAPREYDLRIGRLFEQLRAKHGFPGEIERSTATQESQPPAVQLALLPTLEG
jgi:DNA repair photolyase